MQYRLFLEGIHAIATDPGSGSHLEAQRVGGPTRTVAVYGNRAPKPAGGRGRLALAWKLDGKTRANLIAVADLSTHRVWLFRTSEAFKLAQQHPARGGHHLIMVVDPGLAHSKHDRILDADFAPYLIERQAPRLFPSSAGAGEVKRRADGQA